MHRLHVNRRLRLRLDLLPDAPDVDVYAARCDATIVAPHAIEQVIPGENHSRMRGKIVQQPKLERAEFDVLSRHTDGMRRRINMDVAVEQGVSLRYRILASKQRADTGDQLAHAKRLRDIVIRAELQANHTVGFFAARGEHQDRGRGIALMTAELAADLEPIHSG